MRKSNTIHEGEARELYDSWVNGNRTVVIGELNKKTTVAGIYLTVEMGECARGDGHHMFASEFRNCMMASRAYYLRPRVVKAD